MHYHNEITCKGGVSESVNIQPQTIMDGQFTFSHYHKACVSIVEMAIALNGKIANIFHLYKWDNSFFYYLGKIIAPLLQGKILHLSEPKVSFFEHCMVLFLDIPQ